MQKSIFGFVWHFSKKEQIYILFLTVVSFPILYYSLELPKTIVNKAIGGTDFPQSILGISLDQIEYLFILCGAFLALVLINGAFKWYINVYRGKLGERMLRRLRYELYLRVLLFRLPRFKRMSQGEIIPMITSEVEPLGGFVGDAYALPAFQGGTLLTYIVFIFMQDPILGAAAISLYPLQAYVIPKLQWHVNQLGKRRVRTMRELADRIGETVSGTQEIHAHDTSAYHLADYSHRLGTIYQIRFEIYNRKFFIKFLNNFINQITPFFFYSIGGYLVIKGSLSFGALVAVLAAYKDLSGPWRELLNFYQITEDARIKYDQVVEQFQPPDIQPAEQLVQDNPIEGPLPRELSFSNVTYTEEGSVPAIESLTLSLPLDRHVAVINGGGAGRDELLMLVARLLVPTSGRIRLGEHDLTALPESLTGRAFAYVGQSPFMYSSSLRANLYYGLKHRPVVPPTYSPEEETARKRRIFEAMASGNAIDDVNADWVDYAAAGAGSPEELSTRSAEVLALVEIAEDVYRFGLNGSIDPAADTEVAGKVLHARQATRARLNGAGDDSALVELFDADRYNTSASVAENLLFGTPVGGTFAPDTMACHPYVLSVLDKVGLVDEFVRIGTELAETMIEMFAGLPPGHEFFEQFSFISSDDLPDFQPIVTKMRKEGAASLRPDDRARLMSLPFKLVVSRHRLDLVDDGVRERILRARQVFAADLPESLRGAVEFFDVERYNSAATIQDNILFGKVRYGQAGSQERVQALIAEVVDELELRTAIVEVGLDMSAGIAGSRLNSVQQQKLGLARALLKAPEVLILNEATARLDGPAQQRLADGIRARMKGRGLIWSPHRPGMARDFDEVIVIRDGKVAERGTFEELQGRAGGVLKSLLDGE